MLETATSTSLLQGLKEPGNDAVWTAYVGRYRPLIVRFGRRMNLKLEEAEDLAQETLLAFSKSYCAGNYDREKGRLRSWLFGIARNQLAQRNKRRTARAEHPLDGGDRLEELAVPQDTEQAWEREWRDAVLRQCLEEIRREVNPKTFDAFRRFALEGRPADEVGKELGMSPNAVFGAKRRILERVRELRPLMEEIF
jgi:RNA polymerase sigma-70 factor (ECF subfamily)